MLKFLVDESSGKKLAKSLKERGFDALYCGDYFPGASDEELLEKGGKDKRILITNDKDFGEIIFRHKKLSNGVIFLRLKIDKPLNRIKFVLAVIKELGDKLNKNFVVVSEDKIRVRKI